MLETLDATAIRRWCADGVAALKRHQAEIDALNVYPVDDGDTGTNLVLTLTSAQQALASELDHSPEGEHRASGRELRLLARGALLGARGNSGVIVSQILRGLAEALADTEAIGGRELATAFRAAASAAYAAVAEPVEGTILTVAAAAAAAAEQVADEGLPSVVRAAAEAATAALARTTGQLPVLARAGVVDAGGRGLCVLLDSLAEVVTGVPGPIRASAGAVAEPDGEAPAAIPGGAASAATCPADRTGSPARGYGYEVQYLLRAPASAIDRLRRVLADLGDSLVVVGDEPTDAGPTTWNVHVHVDDVGAAIEAGVAAGRPYRISVNRLPERAEGAPGGPARAVVAVSVGAGLTALFAAEGATVVAGRPSAGELLAAIRSTGAGRVVVLPDSRDTRDAAAEAAREAERSGIRVSVVPTRSPVQALAALAVRNPDRPFDDDVIAMAEAAGACRYAELVPVTREAVTVVGPCRPGDVLGLVDGEAHVIGHELRETARTLLDRLLGGGGELVTLLLGADAPPGLAEELRDHLARRWPFVEVHDYPGGQSGRPLLVGVE